MRRWCAVYAIWPLVSPGRFAEMGPAGGSARLGGGSVRSDWPAGLALGIGPVVSRAWSSPSQSQRATTSYTLLHQSAPSPTARSPCSPRPSCSGPTRASPAPTPGSTTSPRSPAMWGSGPHRRPHPVVPPLPEPPRGPALVDLVRDHGRRRHALRPGRRRPPSAISCTWSPSFATSACSTAISSWSTSRWPSSWAGGCTPAPGRGTPGDAAARGSRRRHLPATARVVGRGAAGRDHRDLHPAGRHRAGPWPLPLGRRPLVLDVCSTPSWR